MHTFTYKSLKFYCSIFKKCTFQNFLSSLQIRSPKFQMAKLGHLILETLDQHRRAHGAGEGHSVLSGVCPESWSLGPDASASVLSQMRPGVSLPSSSALWPVCLLSASLCLVQCGRRTWRREKSKPELRDEEGLKQKWVQVYIPLDL